MKIDICILFSSTKYSVAWQPRTGNLLLFCGEIQQFYIVHSDVAYQYKEDLFYLFIYLLVVCNKSVILNHMFLHPRCVPFQFVILKHEKILQAPLLAWEMAVSRHVQSCVLSRIMFSGNCNVERTLQPRGPVTSVESFVLWFFILNILHQAHAHTLVCDHTCILTYWPLHSPFSIVYL